VRQVRQEAAKFTTATIRTAYKNSGYSQEGASLQKRSLKGWVADSRSPQEDVDMNLFTLRQRSRSLYMGAPLATSGIKSYQSNVVGAGLQLRPKIDFEFLGMTRDEAKAWEAHTRREFALWADKKQNCDATRVNDFYEMQGLCLVSWLLNGDGFALIDSSPATQFAPYSLRIHLIEGDRVQNPNSTAFSGLTGQVWFNTKTGNRVYNGVEIDQSNGGIVAYHVCNFYPNSFIPTTELRRWTRVTAYGSTGMPNILQVMYSERPEQYRGVPLLAPVMESLKQLTRYVDAELVASVINGFFTAFIKSPLPTNENPFEGTEPEELKVDHGENSYEIGPGTINRLMPGEEVDIADPKRPSKNFDQFVSAMAKYIGAAIEVPYEVLLKSFDASYSASRAALLEAWKAFKMRRSWLAKDFCQPIYEIWLSEGVARGRIIAPGFFDDPLIQAAWSKAEWNGPSQGQIDPLKEVLAAQKRVDNAFSTREKETIELTGGDWNANIEQITRENGLMKAANDVFNPAVIDQQVENPAT
jgi:lambda family phage portal protein